MFQPPKRIILVLANDMTLDMTIDDFKDGSITLMADDSIKLRLDVSGKGEWTFEPPPQETKKRKAKKVTHG